MYISIPNAEITGRTFTRVVVIIGRFLFFNSSKAFFVSQKVDYFSAE